MPLQAEEVFASNSPLTWARVSISTARLLWAQTNSTRPEATLDMASPGRDGNVRSNTPVTSLTRPPATPSSRQVQAQIIATVRAEELIDLEIG